MVNLKSKTALIWESGIFVSIAERLAKDFGRVLYWAPYQTGYPTSRPALVGSGLDGVERVLDPWQHIDDVDIVVFPDCYDPGVQVYLAKHGKRVWGSRLGAEMENSRVKAKEMMAKRGIEIGPYKVVTGMEALRKYLKRKPNVYVKIDCFRGDMETFFAPSYDRIEQRLDEIEHRLGASKKIKEFIVEDAVDDAVETGYDGFSIDGQFPKTGLVGVEKKDKAYVGRVMRYKDMPHDVTDVNDKLSPLFKGYNYRGFWSTEIRSTKDSHAYPIDMTARCGSPPSELYQEMIGNISEIIWQGSDGVLVEPEWTADWGAEVLLHSSWANSNWAHVKFPKEVKDNVKLRNYCVIEGETYIIPLELGMPEIGSVVATGKTAAKAIAEAKRIAELVESHEMEAPVEAMDEALDDLTEILGEDKPASKEQTKAETAMKAGKISQRQFEKLAEQHGWD